MTRLSFVSTLSTVQANNVTNAIVTNTSGAPITLEHSILLGKFEVLDLAPFEGSPPLLSAQSSDADLSDVVVYFSPHVKDFDYCHGNLHFRHF